MTEHNNKDNCITQDDIMKMHNIVVHDTELTTEEIRSVWDRVGSCIHEGNADSDRAINPMSACADEFDLNSMVAGAMILTLLVCVDMDMHEGEKGLTQEKWKNMTPTEREEVPIGLYPIEILRIEEQKSSIRRDGNLFSLNKGYMGKSITLTIEDMVAVVDGFNHYRRVRNDDKITNEELAKARWVNNFNPLVRKNDMLVEHYQEE